MTFLVRNFELMSSNRCA